MMLMILICDSTSELGEEVIFERICAGGVDSDWERREAVGFPWFFLIQFLSSALFCLP
ncbi:hypothetical protein AXF42_Ash012973 [Apostasia shenzhenica]|uniref:Uncharacterized protein n=1 Tax=Apostasia shenzhenica TaxID=1088818 RepID=A0A2I0ART0_9ASPA|nr:hypothetical protein AXF42_Ash012973 [Apostasia shenzhenica]